MLLSQILEQEKENKRFLAVHWSQNGEDVILERLFRGQRGGMYLDLGAHDPFKFSNTFLLHAFYGWHGINVDASSDAIEKFGRYRPSDINIHALIASNDEPHTFTEYDGGLVSTAEESMKSAILGRGRRVLKETAMQGIGVDQILHQHLKPGQNIDLMTIDLEGFDLSALETNDWDLNHPPVICIEDLHFQKRGGGEIQSFLSEKGYRLISHCYDTSIYRS